jgi:hypothetical protein
MFVHVFSHALLIPPILVVSGIVHLWLPYFSPAPARPGEPTNYMSYFEWGEVILLRVIAILPLVFVVLLLISIGREVFAKAFSKRGRVATALHVPAVPAPAPAAPVPPADGGANQ